MVGRYKDANTAWTSASDGTLEERVFYAQNSRADVVALVENAGLMVEWVKYSAYGEPFGMPGGDTDSDGDTDATDITQVKTWIDAPAYDVDLDGDVDSGDKAVLQTYYQGLTMGWGQLSSVGESEGIRRVRAFRNPLVPCAEQVLLSNPRAVVPTRFARLCRRDVHV